jgi:hypothetical protein
LGYFLSKKSATRLAPLDDAMALIGHGVSHHWALALMVLFIATCVPLDHAHGQSLDINVDAAAGTGALMGASGDETQTERAPFHLNVDTALVFDNDHSFEWVIGTIVQMEGGPALAINPKVHLVKKASRIDVFASVGLPWYVVPFRRLGFELGGGAIIPIDDLFALVTGLSIQTFFAGADIPDDSAVLAINGRFGVRIAF